MSAPAASRRRPGPGALVLDHVAHFVPDIDAAANALAGAGFTLTPFSPQQHRLAPDAPLTPAGSGNRCVMLARGYLEVLTPTADTPVAQRMRAAIGRYVGLHLICFGTAQSGAVHAHLAREGLQPTTPVALERRIGTSEGERTARFTVVRVAPEAMPEGRIQVVEHHTPELLWQTRWLGHANTATGLAASVVCVADPDEAASRFGRFTGTAPRRAGGAWRVATARGDVYLCGAEPLKARFGLAPPALPWIGLTVLTVADLAAARRHVGSGWTVGAAGAHELLALAPGALGGAFVFVAEDAPFSW